MINEGNQHMGVILKNAPTPLIWATVVTFLGVVAAFVVLAVTGSNDTDLLRFLNVALNLLAAFGGSGALVVASAAAKSAGKAEEHGNGTLAARDAEIARLNALINNRLGEKR